MLPLYFSPYNWVLPNYILSHTLHVLKPLIHSLLSNYTQSLDTSNLQLNLESFVATILDPEAFKELKKFAVKGEHNSFFPLNISILNPNGVNRILRRKCCLY